MEEELKNISNSSATTCQAVPDPSLTAFFIVLPIVWAALFLLNGLVAIMLLLSTSVAIQVRVLLTNLLVAALIVTVVWICLGIYSVVHAISYTSEPSLLFCRFGIFVYTLTVQGRIYGLTLFSTIVLQKVTCSTADSGTKWLIYSVAPCWVVTFIFNFLTLMPESYGVQYVGCIACYPAAIDGTIYQVIELAKSYLSLVIGCIVPLAACICIPLAMLCYIKRHTISEGTQYSFYAKFAAFLIPGSCLTVVAQIVVTILAIVSTNTVGVYVVYSITALSYIPTPILIVIVLKPVRKQLLRLFCRKCRKDNKAIPMQQAETANQQFEMQQLS